MSTPVRPPGAPNDAAPDAEPHEESGNDTPALSRRTFLKILVPAAGGLALTGSVLYALPRETLRSAYQRLAAPELPTSPPGALSTSTLDVVAAFAEAFLHPDVDTSRYQQFAAWRAQNLPGHRALFERFARDLDARAHDAAGRPFATLPRAARVGHASELRNVELDTTQKLVAAVLSPRWLLYNDHVADPFLKLFANTDAWLLLGYEQHPGVARGLTAYQHPLPLDA